MSESTTTSARLKYTEAWMYYLTGQFSGLNEIAEVLEIPYKNLVTFAGRHRWNEVRKNIHEKAGAGLKAALAKKIEAARIAHSEFMLEQMSQTAEVIGELKIGEEDPYGKENKEGEKPIVSVERKLSLTSQQHELATSFLKLDDEKNEDLNELGFRFLVHLQTNTHPANSEAPLGILSSNNALPDEATTPNLQSNQPISTTDEAVDADFAYINSFPGHDREDPEPTRAEEETAPPKKTNPKYHIDSETKQATLLKPMPRMKL